MILMRQSSTQFIELLIFDILSELAIALLIQWLVLILLVFIKLSNILINFLGSPHLTLYQNRLILYNSVMQLTKSTRTKAHNQNYQLMREMFHKIRQNRLSVHFQHPVSWEALGLNDYLDVIAHPMDLSTIQKKLNNQEYQSIQRFYKDLNLIWKNCKTYNGEYHLSIMAIKLEQETRRCFRNYCPNVKLKNKKHKRDKHAIQNELGQGVLKNEQDSNEMLIQKQELPKTEQELIAEEQLSLKKLFLEELKYLNEERIAMLFLMMKTRCPNSSIQDELGSVQIDLAKVDYETVYLAMMQILRWNNKQAQ